MEILSCRLPSIIQYRFVNEPVVDLLLVVDPQPGKFWKHVDDLERLEVVDEDVGHPQVVDELQVHCNRTKKEILQVRTKKASLRLNEAPRLQVDNLLVRGVWACKIFSACSTRSIEKTYQHYRLSTTRRLLNRVLVTKHAPDGRRVEIFQRAEIYAQLGTLKVITSLSWRSFRVAHGYGVK